MARLSTPLAEVLGGRSAGSLQKSHGVITCEDLLWVFPRRYQDMTRLTDIAGLLRTDDRSEKDGWPEAEVAQEEVPTSWSSRP